VRSPQASDGRARELVTQGAMQSLRRVALGITRSDTKLLHKAAFKDDPRMVYKPHSAIAATYKSCNVLVLPPKMRI